MIKRLISFMLSICIMVTAVTAISAEETETYLEDMRIVYADTYEDAVAMLVGTDFEEYTVLNANLNNGTKDKGVWIIYSTTTNVDDALTDIAAMYMDGGYREGNYQAMIEESRAEYEEMSEVYLSAIDYFAKAYKAGDFLAECAFRQLNFYCDIDDHGGDTLGDLFVNGIDAPELAVMFMEGNSYALKNIRSLLAQGVSYNESGKKYTEVVAEMAALMEKSDESCFEEDDHYFEYDDLALLLSGTVLTFGKMFNELAAVEEELNYGDDEYTDDELKYIEYKFIADTLRAVEYLDGKTLYDFCLSYKLDDSDFTTLYPLVAALNEGQIALSRVGHYYDVVRYSITDLSEELMDEKITELEKEYTENPFDIYTGVDRSVYDGTYALTNDAYRADSATEKGFIDTIYSEENMLLRKIEAVVGFAGLAVFGYALFRTHSNNKAIEAATTAANAAETAVRQKMTDALNALGTHVVDNTSATYDSVLNSIMYMNPSLHEQVGTMLNAPFIEKYNLINEAIQNGTVNTQLLMGYEYSKVQEGVMAVKVESFAGSGQDMAANTTHTVTSLYYGSVTSALYFVGGVAMIWSAISYLIDVIDYLIPDYSSVPVAIVDMIDTADGDRYIKYDAVLEMKEREKGTYIPADANAYKADRWVALYTTDSYEAGKPLLAEFFVSHDNMYAEKGYIPVHLFGSETCYNLNSYNSGSASIYLSVKQSENQKSAVADVPEVVGSMIGSGYLFLAAGVGALTGAGIAAGFCLIGGKKKKQISDSEK